MIEYMGREFEKLRECMTKADFYPHAVTHIEQIETHISCVFLTGDYAYKIKKPVNFGFLDFTRLQDRKFYCEEELRLNRRTAPQLYLEVVPIACQQGAYRLLLGHNDLKAVADNTIVEYAVRMQQFDHQMQLDLLVEQHKIALSDIDQMAARIAEFHSNIAITDDTSVFGNPDILLKPCLKNFDPVLKTNPAQTRKQAADLIKDSVLNESVWQIKEWTLQNWEELKPAFRQRKQEGHIRECHGDLHLANIALIQGQVTLFDCIEFSEALRWIDTSSDLAFLLMDLESRGQRRFSAHLMNRYFSINGDYGALRVMTFYKVYRAMVRAKVAALQHQKKDRNHYIELAQTYIKPRRATLLITFGLSGSGKSWGSQKIADECNLVRLRSDVERKRLAGMDKSGQRAKQTGSQQKKESDHAINAKGIYTKKMTRKTYAYLKKTAAMILDSGFDVIVDATFLRRADRNEFKQMANIKGHGFIILSFHADVQQLEQNISQRNKRNDDASDADVQVLHRQLENHDPLGPDSEQDIEKAKEVIEINFGNALPLQDIKDRLIS